MPLEPHADRRISKRDVAFVVLLLSLYTALNLVLISLHEPWRDEAQAWVLARDLSPGALMLQMASEGHPCLWHFILMPFAKLGFPYKTMEYISLAIMVFAGGLFVINAPFGKAARALILFSPVFMYYYPVISRSYCLIALFAVLIAMFYAGRHQKPWRYAAAVAGMVWTHVIMLGFAAFLCLSWLLETIALHRKQEKPHSLPGTLLKGLLLPALSAGVLAFQLLYDLNTDMVRPDAAQAGGLSLYFSTLWQSLTQSLHLGTGGAGLVAALLVVFFVLLSRHKKSRSAVLLTLFALVFQYVVYTFVYGPSIQKMLSIGFILLWLCWTQYETLAQQPHARRFCTVALCGVLLPQSYSP
jgi:hypothetical protein